MQWHGNTEKLTAICLEMRGGGQTQSTEIWGVIRVLVSSWSAECCHSSTMSALSLPLILCFNTAAFICQQPRICYWQYRHREHLNVWIEGVSQVDKQRVSGAHVVLESTQTNWVIIYTPIYYLPAREVIHGEVHTNYFGSEPSKGVPISWS